MDPKENPEHRRLTEAKLITAKAFWDETLKFPDRVAILQKLARSMGRDEIFYQSDYQITVTELAQKVFDDLLRPLRELLADFIIRQYYTAPVKRRR